MLMWALKDIPRGPLLLGFSGLLPFVAGAMLSWVLAPGPLAAAAGFATVAYGACILSFMGAVHWGAALVSGGRGVLDYGPSVVPSLIGWVGLVLPVAIGGWVVAIGLALVFWLDGQPPAGVRFPPWYRRLRIWLTSGAIAALVATMLARYLG